MNTTHLHQETGSARRERTGESRLSPPPLAPRREEAADRAAFHRTGDADAFRRLCEPLLDPVFTVCFRLTRNRTEAEDAAQDTLIRALDRRRLFDPTRPFRPWLLKIATNVCHDRMRLVWWRRVLRLGVPAEDRPSLAPDPEAELDAAGREIRLHEVLAELPPAYREAVVLFHLEDMSYAEMAEITGVKVPALKQRVRRGLILLRERLTDRYPGDAPERSVIEREHDATPFRNVP